MAGSDVGGGGGLWGGGGLAPLYWSFVLHLFQYPATTKQERIGEKSKFFKKRQVDLISISTHKEEQTNTKDRGASNNSLELFHLVEKICVKQFYEKWEKGNKGGNIQPSSTRGMVVSLIYSNLFIPGKHLAQH